MAQLLQRVKTHPFQKNTPEPCKTKLAELMIQQHQRWIHKTIRNGLHVLTAGVLLTMAGGSDFVLLAPFAICLGFVTFPQLVTSRVLGIAQALLTLTWVSHALMVRDAQQFSSAYAVLSVLRVVNGGCFFNAFFCSLFNIILLMANCAAFYRRISGVDTNSFSHLCACEIWVTVCAVSCSIMVHDMIRAQAQETLDIKSSSMSEVVNVRRLLSGLCDAVVALGPDLHISSRAPKLANLLQKQHAPTALEGTLFLDLLAESDHMRFRNFMARACDLSEMMADPEPAQALNVHLANSAGALVQVQLFHSSFSDLNDRISHLIGICEIRDLSTPCSSRVGSNRHLNVGSSSLDCLSDSSMPSGSFTSDLSRQPHSLSNENAVNLSFRSCRFTINQSASTVPVLETSLIGMESLLQWITGWDSTSAWIGDLVNAVLQPIHADSWPKNAGPPHCITVALGIRVDCDLPPDVLSFAPEERSTGPTDRSPPTRVAITRVNLSSSKSASAHNLRSRDKRIFRSVSKPMRLPDRTVIEEGFQDKVMVGNRFSL